MATCVGKTLRRLLRPFSKCSCRAMSGFPGEDDRVCAPFILAHHSHAHAYGIGAYLSCCSQSLATFIALAPIPFCCLPLLWLGGHRRSCHRPVQTAADKKSSIRRQKARAGERGRGRRGPGKWREENADGQSQPGMHGRNSCGGPRGCMKSLRYITVVSDH